MELKSADAFRWTNKTFLTIREFIYLAAGYEPLLRGYEPLPDGDVEPNFYLTNEEFKDFYKQVKIIGEKLPKATTNEIKIEYCSTSGEPRYEVRFLMGWIEGWPTEISKTLSQNPILLAFKEQTPKLVSEDTLLNKFTSCYLYPAITWVDENFYKGKKSIAPADRVFREITEKFHIKDNTLTENECRLVHNLMRIMYGVKK